MVPNFENRLYRLKLYVDYGLDLASYCAETGKTLLNSLTELGDEFKDLLSMAKIVITAKNENSVYDRRGDVNHFLPIHNAVSNKSANSERKGLVKFF